MRPANVTCHQTGLTNPDLTGDEAVATIAAADADAIDVAREAEARLTEQLRAARAGDPVEAEFDTILQEELGLTLTTRWLGMGATTSELKAASSGRDETERFARDHRGVQCDRPPVDAGSCASRPPSLRGPRHKARRTSDTYTQLADLQIRGRDAKLARMIPLTGVNGSAVSGDDAIELVQGVAATTGALLYAVQVVIRQSGGDQRSLLTLDYGQGKAVAEFPLSTEGPVRLPPRRIAR